MSASERPPRRSELPPGLPGPGHVIGGKYVVEHVLGIGGMGAVLAARHTELDERVALKMLLPTITPQGEAVARFVREARAATKIRNEHVVRVFDVGRFDDGAPYIVMEYLEGADLAHLLESSGPLPVDDAVEYVVQASEAIAAAHAMGIVHRDLKPANLFLTRSSDGRPCVKVLDFGISKIVGDGPGSGLTSTTSIMGTPCFMSPEQLRSTRDVDARADIWSIGAILHALLTGSPPYDGESNADVSAKIIRDSPMPVRQLRSDAPVELEAIILRCLEKEPAARFADVADLAQALASVTLRDSVKASAARVARGAFTTAPTLKSEAPPPVAGALSPATRTASAWGETGTDKRPATGTWTGRRVAGVVTAAVVATVLGAVGLVRIQSVRPAASAVASTGEATSPAPTVESVPSAGASVGTSASAGPSASPSASATARTGQAPVTLSKPGRPGGTTATTAKGDPPPAASASPPKPSGGLFDGRE